MNILNKFLKEYELKHNERWQATDGNLYEINKYGELYQFNKEGIETDNPYFLLEAYQRILTGEVTPIWIPREKEIYCIPNLLEDFSTHLWHNSEREHKLASKGLIFKSPERATEKAEEILKNITKK